MLLPIQCWYGNCNTLLVPYYGVRYHLKEWGTSANRLVLIWSNISSIMTMSSPPKSQRAIQFQTHAALQHHRTHFWDCQVTLQGSHDHKEYSPEMQSQLISGLAVIHNFICTQDPSDLPEDSKIEIVTGPSGEVECITTNLADQAISSEEQNWAAEHRDMIALAMWDDYQHNQQGRRVRCV